MRSFLKCLFTACLALGVPAMSYAEKDENGIEPKHWYKFNGNLDSSGATALTISGENGASYTDGVNDQAYLFKSGYHPWGSGMSRGSGDFTVVTVAKTADLDHGIIWAMGTSGTPRGFALVAVGADKVAVRKFGSTWGGEGDIITADVSDATTKYHVFTLIYNNSGCQFSLYVDGEKSPSGTGTVSDSATSGFTNSSFQFGSRNGGVSGSGMTQGYGIALDDFRLYQTTLTTAQIANIVKTFQTTSVWGNTGNATVGGVLTKADNSTFTGDQTWTINFADTSSMAITEIGALGTVAVSSISIASRTGALDSSLVPASVTLTQGGVSFTSSEPTTDTTINVYKPDKSVGTNRYRFLFTFDEGATLDTTESFTLTINKNASSSKLGIGMMQPVNDTMGGSYSPMFEIVGIYTENTDPRTFTATLNGTKKWSELEWSPALPERLYSRDTLQINVSGTSPTLLMDEAYSSSAKIAFSGAVTVGADESFYEDGCWQKDILAGSSITATSGSISTPTLTSGFVGAYSVSSTVLSLRAQNKEVISINIAGGSAGGSGADSPTDNIVSGTDYYGIAPTLGDSWNNINRQWQSGGNQTISIEGPNAYDGTSVIKRETMSLSATGKNTWQAGISNPFLRGYLDDGNGVTVEVHGVPYTKYDVIVYATSDSSIQLNPITINGTEYTYANGATTPGSTVWGVGLYNTPEIGKNALRVNDCTGEKLTITSKRVVGRGTLCAVQVINKGDVVFKSTYTADVNATTTWNDGNGTGLTKYGSDWINGQLSTLTLTNKATAATLTFDTATTGQLFKVVSAEEKALTIPAASLKDKTAFNFVDVSEANGLVTIDISGLSAQEQTILSSSITGAENIRFTGSVTGFGGYADNSGIYLCHAVDLTRKNPVTGEDVANTYAFLGTEDDDWEVLANWRKNVDGLLTPYADSTYAPGLRGGDNNIAPELFDGNLISYEAGADGYKTVVADGNPMVDGFNAQYCLVNGVKVSIGHLYGVTSNGGALNFYVDDTSKMIITTGPDTNYGVARTLNMYVASQEGVVFDQKAYAVDSTVNYYFTGFGSVAYNTGVTAGTHVIKRCQVKLGTGADKIVRKQALVTFASSSVNFSWVDLVIDQDDKTVTLKEVAAPPTLADEIGTYCIQQEENGVYITYVVRAPAWEATISAAGSYALSNLDWNTKPFAPKAGDLIAITVTEGVTEQVELTFDDVNITSDTFRVTAPNANVKLTATEKPANISAWQFNGEGYLIYGWPVDALASSHDKVAYAGGSTEGATIAITHNGGDLHLWGGDWALKESNNSVTTTVEMVDSTVTYSDIFGIGMATYALKGTTAVTTPWLILEQGYLNRDSFLTMEDGASITVTGDVIEDSNKNSVLFGHWDGPSVFTMSGTATFTAAETIVLVGKTANNHTINIGGGTFKAKGIVASAAATGTNTLNLAGGALVLGEYGISSYSADTKIAVNVKGDATITATDPMQMTGLVTIDEGATLTLDAADGTIKLMGGLVNHGTLRVIDGDVILVDVDDPGTCVTEGTGAIKFGYIVDINSCGKKKIPAGKTWEDMLLFDANGNSVTITGHDDKYVYFDWKITGSACWWDYEFNGNLSSTGTDMTTMTEEGTTPYYDTDNTALWVGHATPYRGASYPAEFTAVMYGTMVSNATHILMGFGSTTSTGSGADNPYAISLACGDPAKDEVKLLLSTKFAAQELVTMTVPNAYTSDHLYAFVCDTIDEGGVSKTQIKIYLDGEVLQTYTHSGEIVLGGGFQVGSVHGGAPTNYKKATVANEGAFLDFLRLYREILSDAAMREYASLYPYVTKNGFAERTFDGNANWVENAQWRQVNFDATEQQQAAPNPDTIVYVTCDESSEISLNLSAAANYEQLVFEDGPAVALRKTPGGVVPSVAGVTTVGADLTVDYDAITFGNVTVKDGKTLTFDFASLDISQEWASSTIVLTKTVTLGDGAAIKAINLAEAVGRKAELVQNESTGFYELRISVNGTLMADLTDDTAFNNLAWHIGDEPVEPDWTKKVYGTINVLTDGATLTFGTVLESSNSILTFAGDKAVTLAKDEGVAVTGLTYDFTGLDAKATFTYDPGVGVLGGYVRYDLDMGEKDYGSVIGHAAGTYEFLKVALNGAGNPNYTVRIPEGDEVTIKNSLADLHAGTSFDVCGGTLYIGAEDNASIWYGQTGTRFNMSAGTTVVRANGQGQTGSGNGFLVGFSGALAEFSVSGGTLDVSGSSINFWSATTTNNITGGKVRAKGIFKGNNAGVINVSDEGVLEIGSLGVTADACTLNLTGGTLRGYETGAAFASALALEGDVTIASASGADFTVGSTVTGEGAVTIPEGSTVKLGKDSGLGEGALTVASGATFDVNGFKPGNAITISGTGAGGAGALANTGDEASIGTALTLAADATIGGTGTIKQTSSANLNVGGHTLTVSGKGVVYMLGAGTVQGGGTIVVGEKGTLASNGATALGTACDLVIDEKGSLDLTHGTHISCRNFTNAGTITGDQARIIVDATLDASSATALPKLTLHDNATLKGGANGIQLTLTTTNLTLGATLNVTVEKVAPNIKLATVPENTPVPSATKLVVNGISDTYTFDLQGTSLLASSGGGNYAEVALASVLGWTNFEALKIDGTLENMRVITAGTTNIDIIVAYESGIATTQRFVYAGGPDGKFSYIVEGLRPGERYDVSAYVLIDDTSISEECSSVTAMTARTLDAWIDEDYQTFGGQRSGTGAWADLAGIATIKAEAIAFAAATRDQLLTFTSTNRSQIAERGAMKEVRISETFTGASYCAGVEAPPTLDVTNGVIAVTMATNAQGNCQFAVVTTNGWQLTDAFAPSLGVPYEIVVRIDESAGTIAYGVVQDASIVWLVTEAPYASTAASSAVVQLVFTGAGSITKIDGQCHDANLMQVTIGKVTQEYATFEEAFAAAGEDNTITPLWWSNYKVSDGGGAFRVLNNGYFEPIFEKWYHYEKTAGAVEDYYRYVAGNNWIEYSDAAGVETEANGAYRVMTEEGLAWVAEQAANGVFEGTVTLGADLDLASKNWTPIANFTGTFDGQGHVIAGLNNTNVIEDALLGEAGYYYGGTTNTAGYEAYGLFGCTTNATFRNLALCDIAISNTADSVAALVGVHACGDLTVENVTNVSGVVWGEGGATAGLVTIGGEGGEIGAVVVTGNVNEASVVGVDNVAQILAGTSWDTVFGDTVDATGNTGNESDAPICNFAAAVAYYDDDSNYWTYIEANEKGSVPIDPVNRTARMLSGYFENGAPNYLGQLLDKISAAADGATVTLPDLGMTLDGWSTIFIDRDLTMDLNGNVLYGVYDCDVFDLSTGVSFTIKNGTVYSVEDYAAFAGDTTGLTQENITLVALSGDLYHRTVPPSSLDVSDGTVTVVVPHSSDLCTYILESKASLSDAWEEIERKVGTGSELTFEVSTTGGQGFYRIRMEE